MQILKDTPKIYRFYSDNSQKNRVAVIGSLADHELKIAVSRCSKKDIFVRKKARDIAEGRLKKGKIHSIFKLDELSTEEFIEIAKGIVQLVNKEKITVPSTPHLFNEKK